MGAFLGAMATVFGDWGGGLEIAGVVGEKKKSSPRLAMPRALRAGRIGKCGADARQDSFLPSPVRSRCG